MNPVVVQVLISLVSSALLALFGFFVGKGWMTQEEATQSSREIALIIVPAILAIITGWWLQRRAKFQQKMLVTAQALPAGVTTKEVIAAAKTPEAPDATLQRDEAPAKLTRKFAQDAQEASEEPKNG